MSNYGAAISFLFLISFKWAINYSIITYVPIIFAGNGIKPQTVSRRVHTVDVALTLATAIGTKPPSGAAGEVLLEVLGQ